MTKLKSKTIVVISDQMMFSAKTIKQVEQLR